MMADIEKNSIKDFAEDSDFHGLKQITRSNNGKARRIFWVVLFLIAIAFLVQSVAQQVGKFLRFEHVDKYELEFVRDLDFPAITICNVNKHRRSALTKEDIAIMGPHLELTDDDYNLQHPDTYPAEWVNEMFNGTDWDAVLATVDENTYDMADFFNHTGHQFEELIQHCYWRKELCDEAAWKTVFTHYGKCYSFNSDGKYELRRAGAENGLKLLIHVEDEEYVETHDTEDLGIKFLPHSHKEPASLKELGYGLAPGFHYLIAVRETKIKLLPPPYTECVNQIDMKYFDTYSVMACRKECETIGILNKCGCKLVESPGDDPVCSAHQYECAEEVLEEIEQSERCECENPCNSIQYTFKMSMLELRETTVKKLQEGHHISHNLSPRDLIAIDIYFDLLAFESIEQLPAYTWIDILSDFGGTMGLWLGGSILAAAQLIDFLCSKIFMKCTNNRQRNQCQTKVEVIQAFA